MIRKKFIISALCAITLFSATNSWNGITPAAEAAKRHSSTHNSITTVKKLTRSEKLHLERLAKKQKAEHLAKIIAAKKSKRHAIAASKNSKHEELVAAKQKAAHLARLAAKEKAAWRDHLAKVRELPRKQRVAMIRHDHRFAKKQAVRAAEAIHAKHLHALHLAHLAVIEHKHNLLLAKQRAAHNARLAAIQKKHNAELQHLQHLAQAKQQHDHNLKVAAAKLQQQQNAKKLHLARLQQQEKDHQIRLAEQQKKHSLLQTVKSNGHSIIFWQTVANGVPVKCITVDLNNRPVHVSAVMSKHGDGTSEPFYDMIRRANPNVAVTGTFFSLDNLQPVGDIVIDGSLIHFGGMGTALCITPENHASMVECTWGRHHDWSPYDFVVACGPRLLENGQIVLDPAAERFHDQHMLAPNSRIAVGITHGNKLVFVMTHQPIYLGRLAKIMRTVGAWDAMNLDAGTSTGFYCNGSVLAHPGRRLTNMIVVYDHKSKYENAIPQLVSSAYHRMNDHYPVRPFLERRVSERQVASLPRG